MSLERPSNGGIGEPAIFGCNRYALTVNRGCVNSTILTQLAGTPLESITGFQDLTYVRNLCYLRIYNLSPGLKINKKFDWPFHCVALNQGTFRSLQKYEGPLASAMWQKLLIHPKGLRLKQAWINLRLRSRLKQCLLHLLSNHQKKKLKICLRRKLRTNSIASWQRLL